MKHRMSLWQTLSLTLLIMILVTTAIFYGIMIEETYGSIKRQESHLLTSTGKILAQNIQLKQALTEEKDSDNLNNYTNTIAKAYKLDYVVVMDMQGIRLTHPNPEKIGKPFQGGDEKIVLKGKEVISTAKGSLGRSLRYLIPVFDDHKKQIGAIAVGVKLTTIDEVVSQSKQKYTLALLLCLGVSLCVISFISLRLKRQLHNLEPSEIYQLLEERNAMLDQIEAAVFIIDKTHAISLANQSAKDLALTKMQEEFLIGKTIEDIFTDFHTLDLKQYHDQLFRFCEEDYLVTISPISVKGSLRGYLIFLREAANAINTLEQLVYTTTYASALQAQTHKFMNQLHVIYGLVDIAYYDQLKIYLDSILEPESEIVTSLSVLIKEPLLASFLIGEQEKYKELNCKLQFEMVSDIPACQSKHQLNNCLKIYQYIHTTCLTHLKPKEVLMSISYKTNYLISQYSFLDQTISAEQLEAIFDTHYFKQLLLDTRSLFHKEIIDKHLTISVTTPYIGD